MKKILILLLLSSSFAQAKEVSEMMTVMSLGLDAKSKQYRLHIKNRAGAYFADKKFLECLDFSIKHQKDVKISFETKGLKVVGCEVAKEK